MAKKKAKVILELPIGRPAPGYEREQAQQGRLTLSQGSHLNMQLAPDEASTLLQITAGLKESNVMIEGKHPRKAQTRVDAVRWLLRTISEQIDGGEQ